MLALAPKQLDSSHPHWWAYCCVLAIGEGKRPSLIIVGETFRQAGAVECAALCDARLGDERLWEKPIAERLFRHKLVKAWVRFRREAQS